LFVVGRLRRVGNYFVVASSNKTFLLQWEFGWIFSYFNLADFFIFLCWRGKSRMNIPDGIS